MISPNPEVARTVLQLIEFIGTFAFAISGIRLVWRFRLWFCSCHWWWNHT